MSRLFIYLFVIGHCGGIGRRDGFKIHLRQLSVGSNPTSGTMYYVLIRKYLFLTLKNLSVFFKSEN